uniref:G protein gamma domain-containing protein n=1 Tax=Macrostomum lignano TaxID=282301 RepID=A0A1I8F6Z4_9PLAT
SVWREGAGLPNCLRTPPHCWEELKRERVLRLPGTEPAIARARKLHGVEKPPQPSGGSGCAADTNRYTSRRPRCLMTSSERKAQPQEAALTSGAAGQFGRKMSSIASRRRLLRQLRAEASMARKPVSECVKDMIQFMDKQQGQGTAWCPFQSKKDNPFQEKGGCSCLHLSKTLQADRHITAASENCRPARRCEATRVAGERKQTGQQPSGRRFNGGADAFGTPRSSPNRRCFRGFASALLSEAMHAGAQAQRGHRARISLVRPPGQFVTRRRIGETSPNGKAGQKPPPWDVVEGRRRQAGSRRRFSWLRPLLVRFAAEEQPLQRWMTRPRRLRLIDLANKNRVLMYWLN